MDIDDNDLDPNGREKSFYGVRLFKDQLERLDWLIVHKYHNNRTKAGLIRDAIEDFIECRMNEK